MTNHQVIGTTEIEPGYGQLFAILMRRRYWVLSILCSVVSLSAVYTLLQRPLFQSSMQLLVEPNYRGKPGAEAERQFADANIEIDNSTQLTQMRSSQLLQRAVDLLQPRYPELDVGALQNALVLTQVEEDRVKTKIFQVLYTDTNPQKTQDVLKAIQQVYLQYNREQQKQRLANGLEFIDEQLPVVEQQVREAENALEQFRQSQNLVDPELQSKALVDSLSRIQQERQTNYTEKRSVQARYVALQERLGRSPQNALVASRLSQSSRVQNLLNQIQETELALEKERLRFRDRSPFVQQLLEQRQRQQALLNQEMQRVLGTTLPATTGQASLSQGQLGETDLTLANQLIDAQVNLTTLNARAQSLAEAERSLNQTLRRFPTLLTEYGRLQPRVEIARNTLQQLLEARQELALEIARGGFDWQVVEAPALGRKVSPSLPRNLVLGAIAGIMLGGVAAFIRDSMDDSVHTADDVQKQVALPLLGMVPELPFDNRPVGIPLPFARRNSLMASPMDVVQWQPFQESMNLIYKNIELLPAAHGLKSLVVASALAGEGKSAVALGLAISAARLHQRVLLIDADLRRPGLHKQLSLPNERGLSTLLTDTSGGSHALFHPYEDISVSVLTSGPALADPVQWLSSQRMAQLIAEFEQAYDLVILDAPPVLGLVDAMLTASFCDGAVIVGRINHVTRTELNQAIAALSKVNVIGVIVNGSDLTTKHYFYSDRNLPENRQNSGISPVS